MDIALTDHVQIVKLPHRHFLHLLSAGLTFDFRLNSGRFGCFLNLRLRYWVSWHVTWPMEHLIDVLISLLSIYFFLCSSLFIFFDSDAFATLRLWHKICHLDLSSGLIFVLVWLFWWWKVYKTHICFIFINTIQKQIIVVTEDVTFFMGLVQQVGVDEALVDKTLTLSHFLKIRELDI